jgi:hypothetical protein
MADDWRGAIQVAAPAVATLLGGPLAGLAATVAGRVLLGSGEGAVTTIEEATKAIQEATLTPEGLSKLRELDVELRRIASSLELELERTSAQDRHSARKMGAGDPWTPRILAGFVCMAWLGINGYALVYGLPGEVRELVSRGIGALDGLMMGVFAFYFGSSVGSKMKTEAMAATATALAETEDLNARELARLRQP